MFFENSVVFFTKVTSSHITTGCPNKFVIGSEMFANESKYVYQKECISLQNIAFSAFFVNCKNEKGFLSNLSPISKDLHNKLLHMIIGEKLP